MSRFVRWRGRVLGTALVALSLSAPAQPPAAAAVSPTCPAARLAPGPGLEHQAQRGVFRVMFALAGPHALASPADTNGNGTPDRVDDLLTQLQYAEHLFEHVMGLPHPLRQPRYAQAARIDVFLVVLPTGNGRAYDEVFSYPVSSPVNSDVCALRIDIDHRVSVHNASPLHELLHLFQYGLAPFKRGWLTEGTARWAEAALRSREGGRPPAFSVQALLQQGYAAAGFWYRLGVWLDPEGIDLRTRASLRLHYLDGSPLAPEGRVHGLAFMRDFWFALERLDARLSSGNGPHRFRWREAQQRDPATDSPVVEVLRQVIQAHAPGGRAMPDDLLRALQTPGASR